VKKQWIVDLVVKETMDRIMNDTVIEAIVSSVMALQEQENTSLPLYEQQLRETETSIQNMLNAIQAGILTRSTKARLEELENEKDELEVRIANEKLAKPKLSSEFVTFWLHRFRKLDVTKKEHRQTLIDTFIKAIYLYDDKVVITFNYKDGSKTVTFDEVNAAVESNSTGSDMKLLAAPKALNSSEFRAFLLSAMVLRIYSLILPYGNAGWARPRGNLFFGKEGRHEA
ncbi:MAG: hypothetical protein SOV41_00635, partial [Oscillospiraceae bacterium]|nr:hypothetical protein [Oscillospiraceae bacterium]